MPTVLDKSLMRETGLKQNDNDVYVLLTPSETGGNLVFKEKGKRGRGGNKGKEISIALEKVFAIVQGKSVHDVNDVSETTDKTIAVAKRKSKTDETDDTSDLVDLVDLSRLEARIMMDDPACLTPDVKGRLWSIIRDIREDRREEMGLPPLVNKTTRKGDL